MKKLGILTLPLILAMSVIGCSKDGGSASKGAPQFNDADSLTVENIRNVEFKEERTFDVAESNALAEAAGKFVDDYHNFSFFSGNIYSGYTGRYDEASRYGNFTTVEKGKNYFGMKQYYDYSMGGMLLRDLNYYGFSAYQRGVAYFYSSSNSYGSQYWTYPDATQEDYEDSVLGEIAYLQSEIFYDYTSSLLNDMFNRAYYGQGLIKFGVLPSGQHALVLSTPNVPYYSSTYTYNGQTYVGNCYVFVDMIIVYTMSNGKARLVSGYKEQGEYYDFYYVDGNQIPMPEGELYYYDGEYRGFVGNSTKDLGASHFVSLFPKRQSEVTLFLVTYELSEAGALVNPSASNYTPYNSGDDVFKFELTLPIGKPFKLSYAIEERKLKNGEYTEGEVFEGEITKLEVALGLRIERLEDTEGEQYFFVTPYSGTIMIDYDFSVDTKKSEAVKLFNPVPVPYIY